jgi:virginiamycin B lyase
MVERQGDLWFSEAGGGRIGRISMDGRVREYQIPTHNSQPRAIAAHPDGSLWFVETSSNALGRIDRDGAITEHRVPTPDASLRGVTVAANGELWFTENFTNRIGHMTTAGDVLGEYDIPVPGSGPRCIMSHSSGRLFFGGFDAGIIGEIRLS